MSVYDVLERRCDPQSGSCQRNSLSLHPRTQNSESDARPISAPRLGHDFSRISVTRPEGPEPLPSVQSPKTLPPPQHFPQLMQPMLPTGPSQQEITATAAANFSYHVNLVSQPDSGGDATLQLQISDSGRVQRVFQINYNVTSETVQFVAGGQVAASGERDLFRDIIKVSGFVQVLAGVALTGSPASGALTLQPATGGQVTLSLGAVQFAVQGAVGLNLTQGSDPTLDFAVVPQIAIPLGTRKPPRDRGPESTELTGKFEIRDWVERARYSGLHRLPLKEKIRFVSTILADAIVTYDYDAVARIWRSSSAYEQTQLRPIIEPRIIEAVPRVQELFRRLLTEAR